MKILAPISLGELVDKITILEIKKTRIKDLEKLKHVNYELKELQKILDEVVNKEDIYQFKLRLGAINETLWAAEDKIRNVQDVKQQLMMSIIIRRFNELRASIKKSINEKFSSDIVEEKEYSK
jgi:hypothetical protein